MTPVGRLLARFGAEVEDPDEETFLLFANERPSAQNLGFVDPRAAVLDLAVAGHDLTIHQSPAVLTSNRAGGTTGAVLWNITPRVAEWLAQPDNVFFRDLVGGADGEDASQQAAQPGAVLNDQSVVLELGCGISAVIGLVLTQATNQSGGSSSSNNATSTATATATTGSSTTTTRKKTRTAAKAARASAAQQPSRPTNTVARYVLTDQSYVAKLVQRNVEENTSRGRAASAQALALAQAQQLYFRPLDWETDRATLDHLVVHGDDDDDEEASAFDAVLACDCIYNDALVSPLVQTCADVCRLRSSSSSSSSSSSPQPRDPTLCIVAQQLREPDVLTAWLTAFHAVFRVWRVSAEELPPELQPSAGFVVHVGILREDE